MASYGSYDSSLSVFLIFIYWKSNYGISSRSQVCECDVEEQFCTVLEVRWRFRTELLLKVLEASITYEPHIEKCKEWISIKWGEACIADLWMQRISDSFQMMQGSGCELEYLERKVVIFLLKLGKIWQWEIQVVVITLMVNRCSRIMVELIDAKWSKVGEWF